MAKDLRVVIVEDDDELRGLLKGAVERAEGMRVLRMFSLGDDFMAVHAELEVDVVLMDIIMPGLNGIECVRKAKPLRPEVQFLMLTVFENPAYIYQALCAGATGYLVKNSDPEEIITAIREISEGGSPMSSSIARMVVGSFQQDLQARINDQNLTEREKTVLDQLANGLMYKEIAAKAGISTETVRKHVRNIYEKLQVDCRMAAIRKAYPGRP